MKLFYVFIGIITFASCKNGARNTQAQSDTLAIKSDSISKGHLPFWDSTMRHNGGEGYIDTFSVGGTRFRVVHHDTLYDGVVERFYDNEWEKNIDLDMVAMHQDYNRTRDVNGDGFNDFQFIHNTLKGVTSTYFYDSAKHAFLDTADDQDCCMWQWTRIDTVKKVFYDIHGTFNGNYEYSDLYTYNGFKETAYYTLNFYVDKESEDLDSVVLYKNDPNAAEGSLRIKEIPVTDKNQYRFEYGTYWKDNYKQLLGIQ